HNASHKLIVFRKSGPQVSLQKVEPQEATNITSESLSKKVPGEHTKKAAFCFAILRSNRQPQNHGVVLVGTRRWVFEQHGDSCIAVCLPRPSQIAMRQLCATFDHPLATADACSWLAARPFRTGSAMSL